MTFEWDRRFDLHRPPALFRGHDRRSRSRSPTSAGARRWRMLGDSITTDHISPAGSIKKDSPAGEYLHRAQVRPEDFNSYGARRGNHEVMMRGTFANIRIKNEMVPGVEGGMTKHLPDGEVMPIYDAAMKYQKEGVPLVIIAGKEYGTGSSRDWAAKGTLLLGVKRRDRRELRAHPPLQPGRHGRAAAAVQGRRRRGRRLKLDGTESFDILGVAAGPEAAQRSRLPHPSRRRQGRRRSSCSAASTRSTSSNTSATAASCSTCCGSMMKAA